MDILVYVVYVASGKYDSVLDGDEYGEHQETPERVHGAGIPGFRGHSRQ